MSSPVIELAHALVPVALELAKDYADSGSEAEREEARRKAERATSDRLKLWDMAQAASQSP